MLAFIQQPWEAIGVHVARGMGRNDHPHAHSRTIAKRQRTYIMFFTMLRKDQVPTVLTLLRVASTRRDASIHLLYAWTCACPVLNQRKPQVQITVSKQSCPLLAAAKVNLRTRKGFLRLITFERLA